jgi:Protein of unknown function (DUF2541)
MFVGVIASPAGARGASTAVATNVASSNLTCSYQYQAAPGDTVRYVTRIRDGETTGWVRFDADNGQHRR